MTNPTKSITEGLKQVKEGLSDQDLMNKYQTQYRDFYQAAIEQGMQDGEEAHKEAMDGLRDWAAEREAGY